MNTIIEHTDVVDIWDTLKKFPYMMYGWVKIFLNEDDYKKNRPVVNDKNLIVANGREFVAQKIMGDNITQSGVQRPKKYYNYKISHFAIGSGGADISNKVVTLIGPKIDDRYLYQPITLGNSKYKSEPSEYMGMGEQPLIHSYINAVKPIVDPLHRLDPDYGAMYLESVRYDEPVDYYTKLMCKCVIPPGEPSSLPPNTAVEISEAGLYFTDSIASDIQLFSHICFPPKWMELDSRFIIEWYILC